MAPKFRVSSRHVERAQGPQLSVRWLDRLVDAAIVIAILVIGVWLVVIAYNAFHVAR